MVVDVLYAERCLSKRLMSANEEAKQIFEHLKEEVRNATLYTKMRYEEFVRVGVQLTTDWRIICTELPYHCREKITLKAPFKVFVLIAVPDGTKVTISASSNVNDNAVIDNNETVMENQIAEFKRLKFRSRSGRNSKFDVKITIHTSPVIEAVIPEAMKVTADGIRRPRDVQRKKQQAVESGKKPRGRPPRKDRIDSDESSCQTETSETKLESVCQRLHPVIVPSVSAKPPKRPPSPPFVEKPQQYAIPFSVQESEDQILSFLAGRDQEYYSLPLNFLPPQASVTAASLSGVQFQPSLTVDNYCIQPTATEIFDYSCNPWLTPIFGLDPLVLYNTCYKESIASLQ